MLCATPALADDATDGGDWSPAVDGAFSGAEDVAVNSLPRVTRARPPKVLSAADVRRYEEIFRVQRAGDWKRADRLIKQLDDKLLLGHVLAQRYLHPTKYRSRYKELKAWMAEYADHPQAGRLYKLSLRRRPRNWRMPEAPDVLPARPAFLDDDEEDSGQPRKALPMKRLSKADYRRARSLKWRIRKSLRRGYTLVAKRLIQSADAKRLFSAAEMDQARARLGTRYFFDGRTQWAHKWVGEALARSGRYLPDAHWSMGLITWRMGDYGAAAKHFEQAARQGFADEWLDAAANFWAARAALVTGQPQTVNGHLRSAARHARTFYGLLAARVLGMQVEYKWSSPPYVAAVVGDIVKMPRGRRAMALLQVGQHRRAERELRNLARISDKRQALSILALADAGGMAGLAVRLSDRLFPDGGGFDGAAYPVPAWTPSGGFTVDRALVYALIRQESKFNPNAKSWAGARGLMQLMPRTASFVARDRSLHRHQRKKLFDPDLNLKLGQRYIEMLLGDENVGGDLMLLTAAWNGGPGNLNRWRRRIDYKADPLFFIETIPARETRNFVERVLANLWIYRDRLGQRKPSLAALAAGRWPVYQALGHGKVEIALFDGRQVN